jgi:hypothetical protein
VSEHGVLVRNDLSVIRIGLDQQDFDPSARELTGRGWTLTLKPGWELKPDPAKSRSFIVAPRN